MLRNLATRRSLPTVYLIICGLGCMGTEQAARAGAAGQNVVQQEPLSTRLANGTVRSRQEEEDAEAAELDIDPAVRLQLLAAMVVIIDPTTTTSGVTLTPATDGSSDTTDPLGNGTATGGPSAPEPASFVMSAIGTCLMLVGAAYRRRRRRPVIA